LHVLHVSLLVNRYPNDKDQPAAEGVSLLSGTVLPPFGRIALFVLFGCHKGVAHS